jgi:Tol biopolymer transport system component
MENIKDGMRSCFFLLLLCGVTFSVQAQFYPTQYRPPNQNWQQLQTPHFNIIFAEGDDSSAVQMGQILEQQYPLAQQLVGGELHNFPVILNGYNDRSNGFVTPFHFRSEIELPPLKGKSINPQSGNWLQAVGPHELVHALQFSNLGGVNVPAFLSLFGPDLARSFHGAIPSGITEGLAVHHETEQVTPGSGRGNYPFFTNQFASIFESPQRWSMGQMVQTSSSSRPFNRHYIGGYEFTSWLQDSYDPNTTRKALDFYMDFPFLGYGVALRHATGEWPGQLYDQFTEDKQQQLKKQAEQKSTVQTLDIPYKGREIRRPQWLSDSTLVFYGSFYNAQPGFYQYNLQKESTNRLVTTNSVGDYRYDLSEDHKTLLYSYYVTDPMYDNTTQSELVEVDIPTGQKQQTSKNGRLYAPVYTENRMLALQSRPASSAIVSVQKDQNAADSITKEFALADYEVTALAPHPKDSTIAVVASNSGLQALWIVHRGKLGSIATRPPDISFQEGSVFDPKWHPEGDKLLFSSDFSGTHQLYQYNLQQESINQITHSAYNAFEGSYSPNGQQIAYIKQVNNERLPAVINTSKTSTNRIKSSLWNPTDAKRASMKQAVISDSLAAASQEWKTKAYQPGLSWLKPRAVLPVIEDFSASDSYQLGLALHSNDVLQNQAYSADFSYLEERLWYNLTYQNKQFFPGFKLQWYSDPDYISFLNNELDAPVTLLRQRRDIALSIPFDIQLNQNVYSTSLSVEPEFRYSQLRFFETGSSSSKSDFAYSAVSNIEAQFNYHLQQNIRDVQPNSGLILFSELEHYWQSSGLTLPVENGDLNFSLQQPTAFQGGIWSYLSPLRRWNQSLRIGIEGLTQSGLVFDKQNLISEAFSGPVLINSNNLLRLNSRYTIPLTYPDDGGFLLPFYLNNIYLVAFSDTVTDPTFSNWYEQSRTVFGLELRSRFRISNLSFDIGVGFGYEPMRNQHQFYLGSF